jgi:hypothetical protein
MAGSLCTGLHERAVELTAAGLLCPDTTDLSWPTDNRQ